MKKNRVDHIKLKNAINELKNKIDNMSDDELVIFCNHCLSDSNYKLLLSRFPNIARKIGLFDESKEVV